MKMQEFLDLDDEEKIRVLDEHVEDDDPYGFTEDKGTCSQCGAIASAGNFCFGCHQLVCEKCFEREPHLSECGRRR